MEQRLKGDETYRKCGYCKQPIRDDENATGIGVPGGEQAWFHGAGRRDCFKKWCNEFGGKAMAGQMVMDPTTGELVDEDMIRELYTDTGISGKALLTERCRLGEYVKITVVAQVKQVGESMDDKGAKSHFQKLAVTSIEDVQRGAI